MKAAGLTVVAISGASGLIGSALRRALEADGVEVRPLVRGKGRAGIAWDPEAGTIDRQALEGVDGVVHLAGESIAGARWTAAQKARVLESRVKGTTLLAEAIAALSKRPAVFVSASATGYYGLRGDEALTEDSEAGEGFLAEVCKAWEAAALPARVAGIRVVHPRIGVVLSPEGGALEKMRLPFKFGVGGRLGRGDQYFSWISLPDAVAVLRRCLVDDSLAGPVNAVAPGPVTNAELTKALGRALHRPTFLPVPSVALKAALGGEMAEQLLLGGQRVVPEKLAKSGFRFVHPTLDAALAYTEQRR